MPVKHSLLALLGEAPNSADGLRTRFTELTEGVWPLSAEQIARALSRLERDGLIETAGGAGRDAVRYRPTAAGRADTDRWFSTAVVRRLDEHDELVMKISLSTAGGFDLTALLDAQRHAALERLRAVTHLSRRLPAFPAVSRLQSERRILDLEAEIRFLDRVEALHREERSP
ncbi:PadR family transcriptional regulator [Corynebacterium guangdongense]|uniref:DNA-binding PadR family transcriptional regulator n=1 Tax=Corynebacterium guangdongense TaxID=1783348 RepID=A0ABU1ZY67_9CORY|nr:helix-turn-helix transcriptional regulator [Corynebacterium guangdongense]MDR7328818.1 DNA-binding PadR family transcriptional regulator [Corynebacterium guangdongense]WJZ17393.1 hypothetical protein CGUA_04010 [Corynebacterium guangdongense]